MLLKAIVQGESGTGKNGLLASAADAGYRLIIGSFENGSVVTKLYTTHPENVILVPFEDDVTFDGENGLTRKAKAAIQFERFLYSGRPPGADPKAPPPFGHPKEWDDRTILVLDTLTSLGDACEARALELNPLTREGRHLWAAAQEQEQICELMVSNRVGCHVIVLSHLRLISPKAESGYKDETDLQKQVKRERAALEETGYFPTMVTPGIARSFTRHFPFALLTEEDHRAKHASKRVVRTQPVAGYRIKCPLAVEDKLPIETALATILKLLEK